MQTIRLLKAQLVGSNLRARDCMSNIICSDWVQSEGGQKKSLELRLNWTIMTRARQTISFRRNVVTGVASRGIA